MDGLIALSYNWNGRARCGLPMLTLIRFMASVDLKQQIKAFDHRSPLPAFISMSTGSYLISEILIV